MYFCDIIYLNIIIFFALISREHVLVPFCTIYLIYFHIKVILPGIHKEWIRIIFVTQHNKMSVCAMDHGPVGNSHIAGGSLVQLSMLSLIES